MLDPHPANNRGFSLAQGLMELRNRSGVSTVGQFSYNQFSAPSRAFARTILVFQARANDPAVTIPENVDLAEVFGQQQPWFLAGPLSITLGFNLWGVSASEILNPFSRPVFFAPPITGFGVGHTGVGEWYIRNLDRLL